MISRTFFIIFISVFSFKVLFAQGEVIITGKIIEDSSFAVLPFASIAFENTGRGMVSDANGIFRLAFDTSKFPYNLTFSALGHESKTVSIDSLISPLNGIVILKRKSYVVPVVDIEGMSAKQIVKKAIDKISENFAADTFYSRAFYRQYHKENNFYVRLIEASLLIKNMAEKNKNFLTGRERVQVVQLRRSNDYEMNKEEHGDHLFDLLFENPVYHSLGTVLNRKALNAFKFFPGTDENDSVYHILYSLKNSSDEKIQKGELFIDKKTFAIIRFVKEEFKNDNAFSRYAVAKSVPYYWEFQNGKVIAEYKCCGGKMFLASLSKTYTHELYDNKVNSKEFVVTENFELKADSNFYSQNNLPGNFSALSNLYHSHYAYDHDFWSNHALPEFIFENSGTVIHGLEWKEKLDQQFSGQRGNIVADN